MRILTDKSVSYLYFADFFTLSSHFCPNMTDISNITPHIDLSITSINQLVIFHINTAKVSYCDFAEFFTLSSHFSPKMTDISNIIPKIPPVDLCMILENPIL